MPWNRSCAYCKELGRRAGVCSQSKGGFGSPRAKRQKRSPHPPAPFPPSSCPVARRHYLCTRPGLQPNVGQGSKRGMSELLGKEQRAPGVARPRPSARRPAPRPIVMTARAAPARGGSEADGGDNSLEQPPTPSQRREEAAGRGPAGLATLQAAAAGTWQEVGLLDSAVERLVCSGA